jgi:predicted amidophosphoribosyltransferase
MAASGLAALRDVLVPPRCAGCGASGSWYCVGCRDESDPLVRHTGALVLTAAGAHEGPLRDAIHRLKYGNEPGLAAELGALVARRIAADLAVGVRLDAIVPVRAHPRRERERGYDQASALAAVAAALTGVPLRAAVHRLRSGPAQATLGQLERRSNVHGAFAGVAGSLRGLHVGLIDDVATTAATLLDAAAAARACGARGVRAYVVAFEE